MLWNADIYKPIAHSEYKYYFHQLITLFQHIVHVKSSFVTATQYDTLQIYSILMCAQKMMDLSHKQKLNVNEKKF